MSPHLLEISNSGSLPDGVTVRSLLTGQISILRNPDIATSYLHRRMEKAGRGSAILVRTCLDRGLPAPFWKSDPRLGVTVTFLTTEATTEVLKVLRHLKGKRTRGEAQVSMGLGNAEHLRKSYNNPALAPNVIERTEPDKPTGPDQRYRMTSIGKHMLAERGRKK